MPDADPADFDCAALRCRKPGARWVVLHGHFPLALCADHAVQVEADPTAWRLAAASQRGVLRIEHCGGDTVAGWAGEGRPTWQKPA